MESVDVGDLVQPNATFRDSAGTPTNPTTVTCKLEKPGGAVVSLSGGQIIDDPGAGEFHVDVTPAQGEHGIWYFRFLGTGAVQDVVQGAFNVRQPKAV